MTSRPSAQTLLSLARSRVYERLERAVQFPVLVVAAPAGFGKSTVLREFLAATNRPYRSFVLAADQGDPLAFARALGNGLGDLVPALPTFVAGVYDRTPKVRDASKEIAGWVAARLASIELTLLIDGLENVTDERLFGLLNELVDQTAQTRIRWILVAETADRFPIARWLANDRMDLPIEVEDLALTARDLGSAVDRADVPVVRTVLRALCRTAGNWPAALALALGEPLILGSGEPAWLRPNGGERELQPYAYFAQRAFEARSETERRFLLETCVYKHFDVGLLRSAGWDEAEPMLAELREAGAFLFIDEAHEYRYHEVFRSFLEDRLRAGPIASYHRVQVAAAAVCAVAGRWADALELYTDVRAATPLAALLSEHGFALLDRGEAVLVGRSLAVLGDADFAQFPVALAVKASLESIHGSFDLAEAWFRHAIKHVGDSDQRGPIVFRFATDLVRQDRRDAIDVLEPIVAEGGHDRALAISLAGLLATAYATHGRADAAGRTIDRALAQLIAVDDPAVRAKLYFQAGYVAFFARDTGRAKEHAAQAVAIALASHLYDIAARALSILYNIAIDFEDDIRAGRRYLQELAACSIKAGSRDLLMYATLGQFEIEVLRGNLAESARLDEALVALEVGYSVLASETLLPAQALRATWAGDFHRAYRLLATTAEQQITPTRQAQRFAEIALYAAAAGLRGEADAALRAALACVPEAETAQRAVAFTNTYIALALNLLGRHRHARRVLANLRRSGALTPRLAILLRAIGTVNDRWSTGSYSESLRDALDELDAADFGGLGRMIEALPLPETFRGEATPLIAPEREVLVHLSAGWKVTEIALSSGRSTESVDALIGTVCRKLGGTSARHAVALARNSGILASIADAG